ncbi:MAG: DUF1822 family protein [Cyanobacteria bacterium CRU_2_1]|nr:DUF1822 family protein [Cyanobacteria bacterium RU_5_0]NJR61643.1 DUF1822 family protein [Cyanobacteria bacterium CRU_2_1]
MFTVPLSFEAHTIAQHYQKQHSQPPKAKQVYLNALAVYAVDFYLRCLGFESDLNQSDSHSPLLMKFMDIADLSIKQIGKLECRPVLPNAQFCQIPPDVWSDRIGYVAVQLNQTLKRATLLGFTRTAMAEVPLSQLRSLSDLPAYLNQIRQPALTIQPIASANKIVVNLRQWLGGVFETSWQSVEDVLGVNNMQMVFVRSMTELKTGIKRAKLIDLGMQLGEQAVVLPIAVTLNSDETVNVLVQIYPGCGQSYLPPNLKLLMLSEFGEPLQEVCSRGQDNYIQLRHFKGQLGDRFSIQVALDNVSVTEDFVL